jgi:hypothetical protein
VLILRRDAPDGDRPVARSAVVATTATSEMRASVWNRRTSRLRTNLMSTT